MGPTSKFASGSKGSARKPEKKITKSKKTLPATTCIVDTTEEALAEGITGYVIIGGVPPTSWLWEHSIHLSLMLFCICSSGL
jgi:hypothetical protein